MAYSGMPEQGSIDLIQENPIPRDRLACSSAMRNRCPVCHIEAGIVVGKGGETRRHLQFCTAYLPGLVTVGVDGKRGLGTNRNQIYG